MTTETRRIFSTKFETTDENMATAKESESKTNSFGYVLEMKLPREYAAFEDRENEDYSRTSRKAIMWQLVIDTARYYSIPKEEVSQEVIRCRFLMSQGPQIFEDCYCEWCTETPEKGEQDSGPVRKKFGCIRNYLEDTQTPFYF